MKINFFNKLLLIAFSLFGNVVNGATIWHSDDGEYYKKSYVQEVFGLRIRMIYVEGGEFLMGCTSEQTDCNEDEMNVRRVYLDDYYISDIEIPQVLWNAVMGKSIRYYYQNQTWGVLRDRPIQAYVDDDRFTINSYDSYPMAYVSWNDAQEFCQKLSQITGKNYRLPTEAQWEYAARGGKYERKTKYSGSNYIDDVAYYGYKDEDRRAPVSFLVNNLKNTPKASNIINLYNMSGNVAEWCRDWYAEYDKADISNPQGPDHGTHRVCRGGSWLSTENECRVSARDKGWQTLRMCMIGFRIVCEP